MGHPSGHFPGPPLPPQIAEAAEAFEVRLSGMSDTERVQFLNELLAWSQRQILDLYPE